MEILENTIDVVENITRERFEKDYYIPQKPVVLRGLLKHCPAFKKWNFEYFKKEMGDVEVGIFDASLEKIDRSYKQAHYNMPFKEYLDEIKNNQETKKRLFLFNAFKYHKPLLEDFEFPNICDGFLKSFPFMFFGGNGSVTRIHQDMDMSCVFLSQFEGRKKVILIDPKYSTLLYRFPFNVHTGADITKPDYEKYPGLKYVKAHQFILEFGDTIFMPAGWWHHIEYIGSGFSMSLRCLSPHLKDKVKGGMNVAFKTHIDELMIKMMGKKWFEYKQNTAFKRADKLLNQIESSQATKKKYEKDSVLS